MVKTWLINIRAAVCARCLPAALCDVRCEFVSHITRQTHVYVHELQVFYASPTWICPFLFGFIQQKLICFLHLKKKMKSIRAFINGNNSLMLGVYWRIRILPSAWSLPVTINQFTAGILFFFPVPHAGIFSVKNQKISFWVNETKSRHPNKRLFSLTFRRPLASSDATACYRPAPGRTDGIPERDQRHRDIGYKSVFTNSWLVCQRNRSWIKGLGKINQQKEWTRSLFAVPFVRGHRTVTLWTPRNDYVYTSQAPRWHATHGVLTSFPATHTEIRMPV